MRKFIIFTLLSLLISCGKSGETNDFYVEESSPIPPYDTIAIDSFSKGATSVNIARQIKISSQQFQDSLKEAQKKLEAEKLLKKENDEKEKAAKKLEDEKKKAEALKLKKEKEKTPLENQTIAN